MRSVDQQSHLYEKAHPLEVSSSDATTLTLRPFLPFSRERQDVTKQHRYFRPAMKNLHAQARQKVIRADAPVFTTIRTGVGGVRRNAATHLFMRLHRGDPLLLAP